MRVAIYARVSTDQQTADAQLREVREYCARRGLSITQEYLDEGWSGAKEKRPALDRLMADARRRYFNTVVVWKFDRFARSVRHLLQALEEFQSLGVHFVSLTEAVDTSTPAGKMVFTVLGAVAELERALIRERIRAGMAAARERLKDGPYWRKRNGKRVLISSVGSPRREFDEARACQLRAEGWGWRRISKELNVPVRTLRDRLNRKDADATQT